MLEILELHGTTSRIYQVRDLNQATWPSWLYQVEDDRGVVSEMGSCVSRFKLMFLLLYTSNMYEGQRPRF